MRDDRLPPQIESGLDYLRLVRKHEDSCEVRTLHRLPTMGKKAPECVEALGMHLALLDKLACCGWGCPGEGAPHTIERIVGRTVSHTFAGLRLLNFGHYDEALSLARAIGEAANLLFLFLNEPSEFQKWNSMAGKARWNAFRPAEVRKALDRRGIPIPIEQTEYEILSERVAHVGPDTLPQSYNPAQLPTLGGYFQEAGVLACLNELAWAAAILGASAARLVEIPRDAVKAITETSLAVMESVGGVRLKTVGKWFVPQ